MSAEFYGERLRRKSIRATVAELDRRLRSGPRPRLSPPGTPAHWRCPDCFQPCSCDPIIRNMRHVGCGYRPEPPTTTRKRKTR